MGSKKQFIGFLLLFLVLFMCSGKPKENPIHAYIENEDFLIMARNLQCECGIPASIQIAQAIFESGGGSSSIAKNSNNHFGIKAYADWKGAKYQAKDGVWYRAYKTVQESYEDNAKFLHDNYQFAVGKPASYWVKYCKGYGGEGSYWQRIGYIIKFYKLGYLDSFGKQKLCGF